MNLGIARAITLAMLSLTGPTVWSADPEAEAKAIAVQLVSGDPAQVEAAVAGIREAFDKDASKAATQMAARWGMALYAAQRYDDAAAFALTGSLALHSDLGRLEMLQQLRVRSLIKAGRGAAALAAAKSLYNVAQMRNTSAAIDLVVQALVLAHPEDPAIGKKFRLEQVQGAATNAPPSGTPPPFLAAVKVDAGPYQETIDTQLRRDSPYWFGLGNLYLLADQSKKAEAAFQQFMDWAKLPELGPAMEGVARSIRAQDGTVGRANRWILEQRARGQ